MSHVQTFVPRTATRRRSTPRWVTMLCWANYVALVASALLTMDHKFAMIPGMVALLNMAVLSKARFDTPPNRGEFLR